MVRSGPPGRGVPTVKAVSARVNDVYLFKNGELVGSVSKRVLTYVNDISEEPANVVSSKFALGNGCLGFLCTTAHYRKDSTLGGIHYCSVSLCRTLLKCACYVGGINFLNINECLGHSAEEEGKDSSGVASRGTEN